MAYSFKVIILIIILSGFTNSLRAEIKTESDSKQVITVVARFFYWYIISTSSNSYSEFQPEIIESEDGMTTLDTLKYFKKLRMYNFPSQLINQEKQSYQKCMDYLQKIKYSYFKSAYNDPDHFESSACDFRSLYRCIGAQEPVYRIAIKFVDLKINDRAEVLIEYDNDRSDRYLGKSTIILNKINNTWEIAKISWE